MADSIEGYLIDWGMWAGGFGRGGGYSTPHARLMTQGVSLRSVEDYSYLPPEIELIERAIAQLGIRHRYLKKLIFYRYLYKLQPEEIATQFSKPKAEILSGLERGRDWIGDWLDAQEQITRNLGKLAISNR